MTRLPLAPALLLVLMPGLARAETLHVPGEYPTIQAGIDAANDGDIVELGYGTFSGEGNRDIDFKGKAITVRSFGGNPDLCWINCEGSVDEPHRGFRFHSGETSSSRLEGITIANGYAAGFTDAGRGGAVVCDHASPRIRKCVFRNNHADGGGGAIGLYYCEGDIRECSFVENSTDRGGGAVYSAGSETDLIRCEFTGNTSAIYGGAVYYFHGGSLDASHCRFIGNTSVGSGGAVRGWQGDPGRFRNCHFEGNSSGFSGGAVGVTGETSVEDCVFIGNQAAIRGGAVMFDNFIGDGVLDSCTFYGNSAPPGGGCIGKIFDTLLEVRNTIIAFSREGGSVTCLSFYEPPVLFCTDIFGNEGGDWLDCIADQSGINGNISEDPLFCDPENGDFTLQEGSPCAPFSHPNEECDLIGAWPVGCSPPTATVGTTWGRIKARFR
jgi:hypothetical protein